jgi:hypothetical protein
MKKLTLIFAMFSLMILTSYNEPVKLDKKTTTYETGGGRGVRVL